MQFALTQQLTLLAISHLLTPTTASPIPAMLAKRASGLSRGATAGLAVGIAVAGLIVILIVVVLISFFRQSNTKRNHSTAALNEKHTSTSTTSSVPNDNSTPRNLPDKALEAQVTTASIPRRQKSLKDHLMGPLYRDSTTDLVPPVPAHTRRSRFMDGRQRTDAEMEEEYRAGRALSKRFTIQSFSSRRATRMMMYM